MSRDALDVLAEARATEQRFREMAARRGQESMVSNVLRRTILSAVNAAEAEIRRLRAEVEARRGR